MRMAGRSLWKCVIPAGIDEGQSIRLRGKGMPGHGASDGDLLIKVHISEKNGV